MRSTKTIDLADLPTELIVMIFNQLTPQELSLVSQTCKQFKEQSSIDPISKKFLKSPGQQGQYKDQFFKLPLTRKDEYHTVARMIDPEETQCYSGPNFD